MYKIIINNNEIIEIISNIKFIQITSKTRKVIKDASNRLAVATIVLNSAIVPCFSSAHLFIIISYDNKYIIVINYMASRPYSV